MKNLLLIPLILLSAVGFSQTKYGYVRYAEDGNTIQFGRMVLQRTDHANLDTLTYVFTGSIAYDTINEVVVYYDGASWVDLASGGSSPWTRDGEKLYPATMTDSVGIGVTTVDEIGDRLAVKGTVNFSNDSTLIQTGRISFNYLGFPAYLDGVSVTATQGDTTNQLSLGQIYVDQGGGYQFLDNVATIQNSYGSAVSALAANASGVTMIGANDLSTAEGQAQIEVNKGSGIQLTFKDTGLALEVSDLAIGVDWLKINTADSTTVFNTESFQVKNPWTGEQFLNWNPGVAGVSASIGSSANLSILSPVITATANTKYTAQEDSTKLILGAANTNLAGFPASLDGASLFRYTPSDVLLSVSAARNSIDGTAFASIAAMDTVTADFADVQVDVNGTAQIRYGNRLNGGKDNALAARANGVTVGLEFTSSSGFAVFDSLSNVPFLVNQGESHVEIQDGYSFKYQGDGSYGDGKILTSNADGVGTWVAASYGEMGFGDSTATIALTQNVPTWVTNPNNELWLPGALQLSADVVYDGDSLVIQTAGQYLVQIQLTMSGATGSEIELQLFKNGAEDCFCVSAASLANNRTFSLTYTDITDVTANDVFKVYIENLQTNDDVDVINGKIIVKKVN